METSESELKSKLSVVDLLIELINDSDDESEEYNGDNVLMGPFPSNAQAHD